MGKKRNKYLEAKSKPYLNKLLKQAERDFKLCARETNNEIHDEVRKMYKAFIEQFYDYETTSYVRHFEGRVGTRRGENLLYPWEGIRKNNSTPKLIVEFWAQEMAGGYRFDTPEHVLDLVLHGIRFPYATGTEGPMWENTTFTYNGKYWHYNENTIQDAFDLFGRQWESISQDAFYSRWDKYVKRWKI